VPSALPDGEPVPADGSLPDSAVAAWGAADFGFYVHVPFCRVRCGYCDFNTYTPAELRAPAGVASPAGAAMSGWARSVRTEIALARRVLGDRHVAVSTLFFGGGTPTMLPPGDLAEVVGAVRDTFGLTPDVEITTEANPDSVDAASLAALRAGGINRISFGMQSGVPHVLATLDRTHDPSRLPAVVAAARTAGFDDLSLDLIYGTPGESLADWRTSVDVALSLEPDHLSAYALTVEPGTALARRVGRGEVAAPDDDDQAAKYELADDRLGAAGYGWYEVSNWARGPGHRCRHNLLYWTGGDWWGAGPGAHSHIHGVRWWNVRHPAAYAERLAIGRTPAQAREVLDDETRRVEWVLLESRLASGLPLEALDPAVRADVPALAAEGLVQPIRTSSGAPTRVVTVGGPGDGRRPPADPPGEGTEAALSPADRIVLTRRGRLLADLVVQRLLP
jgi:oxygen-independent coproporphyrinogen-3 oxidase